MNNIKRMQGQNFYNYKTLNLNHIHKFWCGNKFRRLSGLNTKAARVRKLSLLILDCDHHEISWWHHQFGASRSQWCILMIFCLVKILILFKLILHDYAEEAWKNKYKSPWWFACVLLAPGSHSSQAEKQINVV